MTPGTSRRGSRCAAGAASCVRSALALLSIATDGGSRSEQRDAVAIGQAPDQSPTRSVDAGVEREQQRSGQTHKLPTAAAASRRRRVSWRCRSRCFS